MICACGRWMPAGDASGDVRAEVAEVLAAHRLAVDGPTYPACACGWTDNYIPGDLFGSHERHQADALAPLLARREAEARARGGAV